MGGSMLGIAMGLCQLPEGSGPSSNALYGVGCMRLRAASDLVALPGSGESPLKVNTAAGSLSLHFSPWIAVQIKGQARATSGFDKDAPSWGLMPESFDKRVDHAVIRLGNPALHRFRASLGNQRLPFGVDASPADDPWQVFEDRDFWGFSARGAAIAYDNLMDLQFEAGVSGQGSGENMEQDKVRKLPLRTSARLSYDLSFFERAKVVISAADDLYRMRYGFGFVSALRNGDLTHFEMLRSTASDEQLDAGFRRLFRFAYQTSDRRWWLLYDDDRLRARSYAFGYRHFFVGGNVRGRSLDGQPDLAVKVSLGGVRSLNKTVEGRAVLSFGLEATL
ncbi:MAG: hypothetical protein RIQ81_90 [Pseudomonadota bacterium]